MTGPRRGEEGSALVIALFFITIFAILITSVITFTEVGFRAARSFANDAKASYAADGAVNAAINRYGRGGPCDNFTAPLDPDGDAVNDESLIVHCDGPPPGAERATKPVNALLSLGPEGIASTSAMRVLGSIFSNSTVAAGATMVVQGEVGAIGDCTPPGAFQTPPNALHCANTGGGADPLDGRDPDYTRSLDVVPLLRTAPVCPPAPEDWLVEVEPGHYDDAAALSALTGGGCPGRVVWFKPGNYYLDFTFRGGAGTWTVNDPSIDVVAGEPKGWDPEAATRPSLQIPGSCLTETDGPVDGVQLVVGGGTHIQVDRGRVELCAEPSTTTQSIALYGLRPDLPTHNLEPTALDAVTGFTEPGRALLIGESPVETSDVFLSSTGATSAELSVSAFLPSIPPGSLIDTAELRIAHRDDGDMEQPTVEVIFPGVAGGACTPPALPLRPATVVEDRVDLKAECGLTEVADFGALEVRFTASLGVGTAATERLDGIAVEVAYRAPTTRKPTAVPSSSGFSDPGNALEIGEQPALLATADLDSGGATSASLTLAGFGDPPIPPGSTIDSAVLRVAHKDEGDLAPPTITVPFAGSTCTALPLPINATAVIDDRVDLKACGLDDAAELTGLTVTYDAALTPAGATGTASLDGIFLELVYRAPPVTRPPTTVSDVLLFTDVDNAKVIGEQPAPLTAAAALDGTNPSASLKLSGGFDQPAVPAGSFLDAAVLRVVHQDDGDVGSVAVTPSFTGNICGTHPLTPQPGALGVETVDLRPCGLTDPAQLAGLSVTFTINVAPGGTASEQLDGIALDLAYRPAATYQPTATSGISVFTDENDALAIGEQPAALTANAVFGAVTTPATITLNGFNEVPVPPGSVIDSAVLRVVHRDEGMASVGLTATFDGMNPGPCGNAALPLHTSALGEGRVELKAACGFTSASQLASLAASYTATPLTSSANTTLLAGSTGSVNGFTSPDNARSINGQTADAALAPGNPGASLTLSGYGQSPPPAGSTIQAAVLRVAHQDDGDIGEVAVTVSTGTGTCVTQTLSPNPGSLSEDTVDLGPCGITNPSDLAGLSVTYAADLAEGGAAATALLDGAVLDLTYQTPPVDRLDGVALDLVFRAPQFRSLDGCLTTGPYDPLQPATCALVKVTVPAVDADTTRFAVAGTVYAPSAALDIAMTGLRAQVISRGLIARTIRIGLQPATDYERPTAGIPPETVVFTAFPERTATADAAGPSTGFTDPDHAKVIGEKPTRLTAGAQAGATPASLTLNDYQSPVPPGTAIDSAVLRVAHGDHVQVESVTLAISFTGKDEAACPSTPTVLPQHSGPDVVIDQIDLSRCGLTNSNQLGSLAITYTVNAVPGMDGTAVLDGIALDVLSDAVLSTDVRFDRGVATILRWNPLP